MSSDIKDEIASTHALSNDLRSACGWCDQNGNYDTGMVSVDVLQLRKWVEMAFLLELLLEGVEVVDTNDR